MGLVLVILAGVLIGIAIVVYSCAAVSGQSNRIDDDHEFLHSLTIGTCEDQNLVYGTEYVIENGEITSYILNK